MTKERLVKTNFDIDRQDKIEMIETTVKNESELQPEPIPFKKRLANFLKEWLPTILILVLFYLAANVFTVRVEVYGESMSPTLKNGQLLLVDKMAFREKRFERGDIVVLHHPQTSEKALVKRIIGLPGENIKIENGAVYINGVLYPEAYLPEEISYAGEWFVPEGYYFVLGDNRNFSADSHSFGSVSAKKIIGKGLLVYYPLNEFHVLKHQ